MENVGDFTVDGNAYYSTTTGISAAGASQGTATALLADVNNVTTVAAGAGVILSTTQVGSYITILNSGANALLVYPPVGGTIDGQATNIPISVPVSQVWSGSAIASLTWETLVAPIYPVANQTTVTYSNGGIATGLSSTAIMPGSLTLGTGSTTLSPLKFISGTLNTTATAGVFEYDGANSYITNDTTSGRGLIPAEQFFYLSATGTNITTIANFFGTTSNISLVSGGHYEIDIYLFFLKTTAGTVTWTLTNSAAPTSMDVYFEMSPATGVITTTTPATGLLTSQLYNGTTAAQTFGPTASLTNGANHYARFKIFLQNNTGTSLKIQAAASAGSITPGIGSRWYCKRVPTSNVGTFAA